MQSFRAAIALGLSVGALPLIMLVAPPAAYSTAAASASSSTSKPEFAPDPTPVATTKQWVFTIIVKDSVPALREVTEVTLKQATATPRVMGRFAVELLDDDQLLDRHRFDVPLNGDGPRGRDEKGRKRPTFRVNTKMFVRLADHERCNRARLVDRSTGEATLYLWPPNADGSLTKVEPAAGPSASATPSAAPSASAVPSASSTP
jgi:hypothetical protein